MCKVGVQLVSVQIAWGRPAALQWGGRGLTEEGGGDEGGHVTPLRELGQFSRERTLQLRGAGGGCRVIR